MKDFVFKVLLILVLSSIMFFIVMVVKTVIEMILAVGG